MPSMPYVRVMFTRPVTMLLTNDGGDEEESDAPAAPPTDINTLRPCDYDSKGRERER